LLYAGTAWAINRIVGSNLVAGKGITLGTGGAKDTVIVRPGTHLTFDTDSTIIIGEDVITKSLFGDEDWGDMSVATNAVTIDEDVIDKANFADEDWGDMTVSSNSVTLDANCVGDNEIDYSAVTLDDFDYQTAWRVFYSNADGDVVELALGADGTYLKSNGASAAPTWDTPSGTEGTEDTVWFHTDADDDSITSIDNEIHLKFDATGLDATIAGDTLTVALDTSEFGGQYLDDGGGEINNANDFNFASWTYVANLVADSCRLFPKVDSTDIDADNLAESDINWEERHIECKELAVHSGVDDDIELRYPLVIGNYDWVCEHSGQANDQKDTIRFSILLPDDSPGLDSIRFSWRASGAGTSDASLKVVISKRSAWGGAETDIDSMTTAHNATWTQQQINSFGTNATGGDQVIAMFIVTADNEDSVLHTHPVFCDKGK